MIETKEFSCDLIYEQIKGFCLSNGITKEIFSSKIPCFVYKQTLVNNVTMAEVNAFKPFHMNDLFPQLKEHLEINYGFKSKFSHLIYHYESVFNHTEDLPLIKNYYLLDSKEELRFIYAFEFSNLDDGDYDILLIELSDSDIDDFELDLFNYYKKYIIKNRINDELKKPLSQLTSQELDVVRMVFI